MNQPKVRLSGLLRFTSNLVLPGVLIATSISCTRHIGSHSVIPQEGLYMRTGPSKNSKNITLMPRGSRVDVTGFESALPANIQGAWGYWTQVVYRGQKGFAFSGFLAPEERSIAHFAPISILLLFILVLGSGLVGFLFFRRKGIPNPDEQKVEVIPGPAQTLTDQPLRSKSTTFGKWKEWVLTHKYGASIGSVALLLVLVFVKMGTGRILSGTDYGRYLGEENKVCSDLQRFIDAAGHVENIYRCKATIIDIYALVEFSSAAKTEAAVQAGVGGHGEKVMVRDHDAWKVSGYVHRAIGDEGYVRQLAETHLHTLEELTQVCRKITTDSRAPIVLVRNAEYLLSKVIKPR